MSCCVPKADLGHLFTLEELGYIKMNIELTHDYGDFKAGDDISGLGNAQKKFLLNIKAAKLKSTGEVNKDEKSDNKRTDADSNNSGSKGKSGSGTKTD